MEVGKAIAVAILILITLVLVVFGPFMTIWSLNTIFGLKIVYSFKTWAATIWILVVLHGIKLTLWRKN